jgi:hypothetical protein
MNTKDRQEERTKIETRNKVRIRSWNNGEVRTAQGRLRRNRKNVNRRKK